ncbi:transcriptional regulator, AraC family [Aquimarina spongiae]|uniref:Transcriptional regulator, AraC family n=2 Tax=Aquimarina spongiae TaxID=570521 RepID=A0A1M6HPC3_9FLAO|nr:transcriptional regulator, AraC family [Aquimarina spongiae]
MHKLLGLGKPRHPAISLVQSKDVDWTLDLYDKNYIWDFYMIGFKYHDSSFLYGRKYYDFEEGTMVFTSPGQVIKSTNPPTKGFDEGWTLYFHPDFIQQSELGKKIKKYSFFSYASNEALHLSENEKTKISQCVNEIEQEYSQNIDTHSQTLIISNLELLLNYCNRFYDRQFYTRSNNQQDIVVKIEEFLTNYYNSEQARQNGIPTVKLCAEKVNLSQNYLSDLLKKETGKNTQEQIHFHLIEKAKNMLLNSNATVSEIAYDLGFDYPQYFGNLFKSKTGVSPNKYRTIN